MLEKNEDNRGSSLLKNIGEVDIEEFALGRVPLRWGKEEIVGGNVL